MKKGFWEKGMTEFMAVDGNIYKVNPENGIYKAKEVDEHGNVKYVSRLAGSCTPDSEHIFKTEKTEDRIRVTETDKNGRIYGTDVVGKR